MRFYSIIGIIGILIIWSAITYSGLVDTFFLPPPGKIFSSLYAILMKTEFLLSSVGTLKRIAIGYFSAAILGIVFGLIIGRIKSLQESFIPIIDFFRSIPATALFPLFVAYFGLGNISKIAVLIYSGMLIIIINTAYGVKNASEVRQMAAHTLGIRGFRSFITVIFPDALPHIAQGLRTVLSLGLIVMVVTEMMMGSSQPGLGRLILDFYDRRFISEMYAVILIIGAVGFLINRGFLFVESHIIHWWGK